MHSLESLGWTPHFERQIDPILDEDLIPARVAEEQRGSYRVLCERGLWYAELSGRLRHELADGGSPPCVGDWVLVRLSPSGSDDGDGVAVIQRALDRRTRFSRQAAGTKTAEQVVAANIDTIFLVQSLNGNLNARRLERYLALLWESGAEPVVVLSKADLSPDPAAAVAAMEGVARGVGVHAVSAVSDGGLDALRPYLLPGRTAALVGSSGVGKSTIVNQLVGQALLRVEAIRESDDRGRHTTAARHLIPLPGGGLLLDTPGMRTVLLWGGEEGLARTFEDIEEVAAGCRFRDCTHESEPGCAVREALEGGALDPARLRSWDKLRREARHQAMKSDRRLRLAEARRWRRIALAQRRRPDKREI